MSTTFESDWENTRLKEQLAAKDDEIRELVTSDNKVVADLSRYVETLEQKIADKNDAYRAACAVVAKMHEAAIGEVVGPVLGVVEVVANVREQLIEAQKQIVMLREVLHGVALATDPCVMVQSVVKALADTQDLSNRILCDAEPVFLFRRLGRDDYVTCDASRYNELSLSALFETKKLYEARTK